MEAFWILILVAFFATNSLDKAESVKIKLEETPLKTFDEIFGEGWCAKDEAEDLKIPSTDQNPPLTKSDHSDNAQNGEEQNEVFSNENIADDEQKRKIIDKFHEMKDEFKQKVKYSTKEWAQIEKKIAKHLKVNRSKIYKWKKEFGLGKMHNFGKKKNERRNLVEKFDQMKAELKQAGFKNFYKQEIDKAVAKRLGLSFGTIYNWKSELGQTKLNHKHPHIEQNELMKCYYQIKDTNPKIKDKDIAKMLNIGSATLIRWKRQFKRQQLHPNSVNGQSVDLNAGSNIHEIGSSN